MTDYTRRKLLSLVGTSAVTVGCIGDSDPKSDNTTGTTAKTTDSDPKSDNTTGTTAKTTDSDPKSVAIGETGAETVVDDVWFRTSFRYRYGAHRKLQAVADAQFVFAHVSPKRPPSEFSFVVDGNSYPAKNELRNIAVSGILFSDDHSYDSGRLLTFEVPRRPDASSAHVAWPSRSVRWTLDDSAVDRLNSPPSFGVESVSVPESVAASSEFSVSALIRNSGGRRDVFLASVGLNTVSDLPEIRVEVPADGTTEWNETYRAPPETGTIEFSLNWGLDSITRSIQVE